MLKARSLNTRQKPSEVGIVSDLFMFPPDASTPQSRGSYSWDERLHLQGGIAGRAGAEVEGPRGGDRTSRMAGSAAGWPGARASTVQRRSHTPALRLGHYVASRFPPL